MNFKSLIIIVGTLLLATVAQAFNLQGVAKESTTLLGSCLLNNISVRYHLGVVGGQPNVRGTMKYDGKCSLPLNAKLVLLVSDSNGSGGYIKLNTVADAEANTYKIVGPKKWPSLFCRDRLCTIYLPTSEARSIMNRGAKYKVSFYELRSN